MISDKVMERIDTPALIIDVPQMKENIREYHEACAIHGVHVRPHTKTHKMPEIAKMQLEMGARGIAVAKISEAEVMADAGIDDILICYPIIGRSKLERLAQLNHRLERLIISVESLEGGRQLSNMGVESGKKFRVIADVDTGDMKRTGFPYDEAYTAVLELAKMHGIEVIGIYAYAYLTYKGQRLSSAEEAGHREAESTVALAKRLEAAGLDMEIVAGGSAPTGRYVAEIPGITEVHPGEYPFYDCKHVNYGYSYDQCAATILATVVSSSPERIVIDGGSKTFSTDMARGVPPLNLVGYGVIVGHEDDLILDHMSEEHGVILSRNGTPLDIPIGTKLRIIPNHICPCLVLHSYAYFVDRDHIEKVWIQGRGKLT